MLYGFEKKPIIKFINKKYDSSRLKTRKTANKFLLKLGESDKNGS